MSTYKYFLIPFENVPTTPSYTVWFATWSAVRPPREPNMNPPMVVGVTTMSTLPAGAVELGSGDKDPLPPPPPPPPSLAPLESYKKSVNLWLTGDRDADEAETEGEVKANAKAEDEAKAKAKAESKANAKADGEANAKTKGEAE